MQINSHLSPKQTCIHNTSLTRLQEFFHDVFQDVSKTSSRRVCKAPSSRCFANARLKDVLENKKIYAKNFFKTSSKRLQYVFKTNVC